MSSSTMVVERSPLDQIRQAETEVTRQVAAARGAAETAGRKAQAQAADLKRQAREVGQREGQELCREITSKAEEEARALVAQAHIQAEELRRKWDLSKEAAVRWALTVVIECKEEAGAAWNLK
jgi:vacuolar-type H+-ATPase subunit H